jgi:acetoin utilization deacetylase AcuC-like enzyme
MKLIFSDKQLAHRPRQTMVHGRIVDALEKPDRATTLIEALGVLGLARGDPVDAGHKPIMKVHSYHYVTFLQDAWQRFAELPDRGPELLANAHPYLGAAASLEPRIRPRSTGIIGRAGWYMGDMSCAIMEHTYDAAYWSAQAAATGAEALRGGERAVFALCRPPGHHAYADRASGFCYLNNAAIAAEVLRTTFAKVAIVDFDTHHGDGTQAIFYARDDVLYASVHTDPSAYYPHYFGYADETGTGKGAGANLNVPLVQGSGDDAFVEANARLAQAVTAHGAGALVISAGWDAHQADPLSRLAVTTPAYARIGEIFGRLKLPTLIVQEGGYSLPAAAQAAPAFVTAFRAAQ